MSPERVTLEFRTASAAETIAVGSALGALLNSGELVALVGDLGAGKTHFTKGLARGLGVPADEPVVSPTFVLVREYAGRVPLFHCDAYRLAAAEELDQLGLPEMLAEAGGVVAVEWADRFPDHLPAGAWWVELDEPPAADSGAGGRFGSDAGPQASGSAADGGDAARRIRISCPDPARAQRLAAAQPAL